jgi:hypothetical protein
MLSLCIHELTHQRPESVRQICWRGTTFSALARSLMSKGWVILTMKYFGSTQTCDLQEIHRFTTAASTNEVFREIHHGSHHCHWCSSHFQRPVAIFWLAQKLNMEMNRSIGVLDKHLSVEELVTVLGLCKLVQTLSGQFDALLVELSSGIIPAPGFGYCNQMRCLLWMVLQDDPEIEQHCQTKYCSSTTTRDIWSLGIDRIVCWC